MTTIEQIEEVAEAPHKSEASHSKHDEASSSASAPSEDPASILETLSFGDSKKKKILYLIGATFAMFSGVAFPIQAYMFARSFEELSASTESDDFLESVEFVAYSFMVIGATMLVSISAQTICFEIAATEMTNSLKAQWFEALLRQDMAYFDVHDVSGTATLISANASTYRRGVGRKLGEGVQYSFTVVGGMAYALYASWQTTLVIFGFTPLLVIPLHFLNELNQSKTRRANESYAKAGSISYSAISSIRTVLSLNSCEAFIRDFQNATMEAFQMSSKTVAYEGFLNGLMMGMFLLFNVVLTLFGAYLLYDGVQTDKCDPSATTSNTPCDPTAADIFGAMFGVMFAASVLPQVSNAYSAFVKARAACKPALSVINLKSDTSEKPGTIMTECIIDSSSPHGVKQEISGHIEFKDVFFHYPSRPNISIFSGLNLNIPVGTNLAIVGASGSGKSTVVALLERFYDVSSGALTIDGVNIKDYNIKCLRDQIGLVQQEPALFSGSIRENIAYGNQDVSQEEIEVAAKKANAHDFIMSFPNGYDTEVGNKGTQISGGQKQRIAIARILVREPKIVVFDEATSALDVESESIVQAALGSLLRLNRTTITIAHRLSTIRGADLIAVVGDGKICEIGKHEDLMQKDGAYKALVDAQMANKEASDGIKCPPEVSNQFRADSKMLDDSDNDTNSANLIFKDICFSYPTRPENQIFKSLNLVVKSGETLAIVGNSGCGKSTVFSLIERFYDPQSGVVTIDGEDIKTMKVRELRDLIGFVGQEPVMFNASIKQNIALGHPGATMDEIEVAAKRANAHDFIAEFPKGYDTNVGEGGSQLSGGQKQRIAIARAILKSPRFLLLDEATSALDSESERIVQEALDDIMGNAEQTVIVVAHRLSTIRKASRIAVIEGGKVKEIGTHSELMEKNGSRYRELVDMHTFGKQVDRGSVINQSRKGNGEPEQINVVIKDDESNENFTTKVDEKRALRLAKPDLKFLFLGTVGAALAGFVYPGWGIIFAEMIDLLYKVVPPCSNAEDAIDLGYDSCKSFFDEVSDEIEKQSYDVTYQWLILVGLIIVGNTLLFYGFGMAAERMSKRTRDRVFEAVLRQEVTFFDKTDTGALISQLQEDASMLHAFSGDPIRAAVMVLTSVVIGLIVSFIVMWPFALLVMGILPFMMFEAEMEMKMYLGTDEGDDSDVSKAKSSAICVESLVNMSTVASLSLEKVQHDAYCVSLHQEVPDTIKMPLKQGSMAGLGMFIQNWGVALMFWWGGYILVLHPTLFDFKDLNISMFALLFGLSGFGAAVQGAADRGKAEKAVDRLFALIDRKSIIDPLD